MSKIAKQKKKVIGIKTVFGFELMMPYIKGMLLLGAFVIIRRLYDGTGAITSRSAAIISMEAEEANMGLFCRIRRSVDKMFRSLMLFTLGK